MKILIKCCTQLKKIFKCITWIVCSLNEAGIHLIASKFLDCHLVTDPLQILVYKMRVTKQLVTQFPVLSSPFQLLRVSTRRCLVWCGHLKNISLRTLLAATRFFWIRCSSAPLPLGFPRITLEKNKNNLLILKLSKLGDAAMKEMKTGMNKKWTLIFLRFVLF